LQTTTTVIRAGAVVSVSLTTFLKPGLIFVNPSRPAGQNIFVTPGRLFPYTEIELGIAFCPQQIAYCAWPIDYLC
jgi:hypothetical protein